MEPRQTVTIVPPSEIYATPPSSPLKSQLAQESSMPNNNTNDGIHRRAFTKEEIRRINEQWKNQAHVAMREGDWVESGLVGSVGNWFIKRTRRIQLEKEVEDQRRILQKQLLEEQIELFRQHNLKNDKQKKKEQTNDKENAEKHPPPRIEHLSNELKTEDETETVEDDTTTNMEDAFSLSVVPESSTIPPILSRTQMAQIAQKGLPPSLLFCKWKRLYSLTRDGDSFETMLRLAKTQKSLLVVRSYASDVFGGYVESPWEINHLHDAGGRFYGSCKACLFRFRGEDVEVYKWTGANRYVQLCERHGKTLAMGGGGDRGAFGLCVADDFRRGSTGRCETFRNEPLTEEEQFEILDLEVWGFVSGEF